MCLVMADNLQEGEWFFSVQVSVSMKWILSGICLSIVKLHLLMQGKALERTLILKCSAGLCESEELDTC